MIPRTWSDVRAHPHTIALVAVLTFAFLVRIIGIGYGLPLMPVADEPPFPLAALKMLELRTLIPTLHTDAFSSILYYPPYLSYLYLPFFALAIGILYLLWSGASVFFIPHLLADLSVFFIIARLISVLFGVASVYLVYKIADALFESKRAALIAAFFLATSIAHSALSMVARHWVPVTFILLLVLFILTRTALSETRRYGYALLLIGVSAGISTVCLVFAIPLALHFFLFSTLSLQKAVTNRFLWISGCVAALLAVLPSLLYSKSTGFITDITFREGKSLVDLVLSPLTASWLLFPSEPVLVLGALAGLMLLWRTRRRLALFFALTIYSYSVVFYIFFRFETRFLLPLIPLAALLAGVAMVQLLKIPVRFLAIALLIPLLSATALGTLAFNGDTRSRARTFVLETFGPGDRILVYANPMRITTTRDAVEELRMIAPEALRKADEADSLFNNTELPHVLNLYGVHDEEFFATLPQYAAEHWYQYLLIDPEYGTAFQAFDTLTASSTVVATWSGMDPTTSIGASSFRDPFWRLFSGRSFGPDIVVYQLDL